MEAQATVVRGVEAQRLLTLLATILGSSISFLDATVVTVALPTIERDLHTGLAGEQWIVLAYSLALASLYLVGGAVGDRLGHRRVFVGGVLGFALASALAGAAPDERTLIAARALQGIAGAVLTPGSLALLREAYGAESGRAIGLWSGWTGISTVAGPLAGGALVEWASWRWIFFLNLPLAVVTVALALAGRSGGRRGHPAGALDVPGAVLAALAFGTLTYGLVEGERRGFGDPAIVATLAVAGASFVAFVLVELRASEPMLPFSLFQRRNFAAANAETFLVYAALSGSFFFLPLFLQSIPGYSPFAAGALTAPVSAILLVLAPVFGRLADWYGPRLYLAIGPAVLGGGILLLLRYDGDNLWTGFLPAILVFSFGLAAVVAPITATALQSAPERYAGIAAGVNTTVSRVGGLIAIALLGVVVSLVFDRPGVPLAKDQRGVEVRAASTRAFHAAMIGAAALALAGAAVGAAGISNRSARAG
jgi:EmrB/QacA subfamily drug resistance transporter